MKLRLYATLCNSAGELDSRAIDAGPDDDIAEISAAIWHAIDDWMLAPGDTIRILQGGAPLPDGVTVMDLNKPADLHASLKQILGD